MDTAAIVPLASLVVLFSALCPVLVAGELLCADLGLICSGTYPRQVSWTLDQANVPSTDGSAYVWNFAAATNFSAASTVSCEQTTDQLIIRSAGLPSSASWIGLFPFNVDTDGNGHNDNPNTASAQSHEWKIPRFPTIKTTAPPQATSSNGQLQLGPIAFALDGVPFFNPFNNNGDDAVDPTSSGFEVMDLCYGHPTNRGAYHHHYILSKQGCLFQDTAGQHSPKIGYAFDGIAIYGPLSDNGVRPTDLDACSGRTHPTLGYIYHTTATTYPYVIGCYRYQTIRQGMIQGTLPVVDNGPGNVSTACVTSIGQNQPTATVATNGTMGTATGTTAAATTGTGTTAAVATGSTQPIGGSTTSAAQPLSSAGSILLLCAIIRALLY